jgi:hypothetical protein
MEGVLIVAIIFGSIASVFIVPRYLRSQERMKMAEALRVAIEKGQTISPDMMDAMSTASANVRPIDMTPTPQRDLRTGIIWMGVAAGLVALGLIVGMEEPDASYWFLGFAAFPGFIGLAFIVLGLINKPKS